MDIQVASNFERLLYYALGEDSARVVAAMAEFNRTGSFRLEGFDDTTFSSSAADDAAIAANIRGVQERHGYVVDPHTACGFERLNPDRFSVVLATAHPAKFPEAMRAAIDQEPTHPSLEALKSRRLVKHELPADLRAVQEFIAQHAI
jgi:threonine synthase